MSSVPTKTQISAGGVAFRKMQDKVEVVLISVGEERRWQLPKGLVGREEENEAAALREVSEEGGVDTELLGLIDRIEYWYYSSSRGKRLRFHKFVYFYLLRYQSGQVEDHDDEVHEAAWVEIDRAMEMLAFSSEKKIVQKAAGMIAALNGGGEQLQTG
jgi:8-oxo-dGTP diphosphatase